MRVVEVVGSAAPIVGVVVGVLMAVRRRLVRYYEKASAFAPDSAVAPPQSPRPLTRWWRQRLLGSRILRALPDGREWLDAERWESDRRMRRRRALTVVTVLAAALGLAAWLAATRR